MSNRELPQRWADRMVERGFTDPRYTTDIPSLSSLAKVCGIHTSTISSAIKGTDRQPSAATIVALTKALGDDVAGWLGENHAAAWEPPAESSLLTGRQRKAVEEIIRAMTERREDVGNDDRSAANTASGQTPDDSASDSTNVTQLPSAAAPVRKAARKGRKQKTDEPGDGA